MVEIMVFGTAQQEGGGCGCGHVHSMRGAAELLEKTLRERFGDSVDFRFVDVFSEEIMDYPDLVKVSNQFRLPLTFLDGEPRFHGGMSVDKISAAVAELLGVDHGSGYGESE